MRVLVSCEPEDLDGAGLLGDDVEVLLYDPDTDTLDDQQRQADVLVAPYHGSRRARRFLDQIPNLRLVQLLSAGADQWIEHVPASATVVTARGAHAEPVSEWVLSAALTMLRCWPELITYQSAAMWTKGRITPDTLYGKRALILGAGHIGRAVAAKLAVFGAAATLVGRTARPGVHGVADLVSLAASHEVLVIAAPLTEQTYHLVDPEILAALPDGALVINAGRGAIVDTDALVAELDNRRLRAALDVVEPEPLPAGHPLWRCPGVIISPHSARTVPGTARRCYRVAAEQIDTFLRGGHPTNIVEQIKGTA